ncbi:MAG: hypothetical protein JHC37_00065 [Campylobacteraceae bacterium]|nr:hypothetical protein [Campylobacteraceae bacterium]
MQIGGINSFISQLSSLFQKKTDQTNQYSLPSGEITINSIIEKLSIDKKTQMKRQEIERTLTGFGKEVDEYVRRISEASAEIYRATLESELKNRVKEMTQKEQASRVAAYQSANSYQNSYAHFGLNLYS